MGVGCKEQALSARRTPPAAASGEPEKSCCEPLPTAWRRSSWPHPKANFQCRRDPHQQADASACETAPSKEKLNSTVLNAISLPGGGTAAHHSWTLHRECLQSQKQNITELEQSYSKVRHEGEKARTTSRRCPCRTVFRRAHYACRWRMQSVAPAYNPQAQACLKLGRCLWSRGHLHRPMRLMYVSGGQCCRQVYDPTLPYIGFVSRLSQSAEVFAETLVCGARLGTSPNSRSPPTGGRGPTWIWGTSVLLKFDVSSKQGRLYLADISILIQCLWV